MLKKNLSPENKNKGIGDMLWVTSLGINLVLSTFVGVGIGFYLDKWLHTSPVMIIVFFLLGTFAGFRQILREIKKLDENDKKSNSTK